MKKISFFSKVSATASVLLLPMIAFAQFGSSYSSSGSSSSSGKTLADLIDKISYYLNSILVLFMGVAIVVFVFYVIKYFIMPNEERKQAASYVMYSVIGFFVVLSFWGLVNIVQNTFGLQSQSSGQNWSQIKNLFPTTSSGNSSY